VILAEIGSTAYDIMLLLHVLAVIVAFAPAWMTPVLMRVAASGDRGATEALEMSIVRFSLPALALAGILGFGLAGMSDDVYEMSQGWLAASIVLWLGLIGVIWFVTRPGIKAFQAGDTAARGKVMAGTGIAHLVLLVMLYLMIFKPGL
jgi:uncharacterized membrane protein